MLPQQAHLPVELLDANGQVVARAVADTVVQQNRDARREETMQACAPHRKGRTPSLALETIAPCETHANTRGQLALERRHIGEPGLAVGGAAGRLRQPRRLA